MKRCEVYRLKPQENIQGSFYRHFYLYDFAPKLSRDGSNDKVSQLFIVGIDISNCEFAQILDKYVIEMDDFYDLFEDEPFWTYTELIDNVNKFKS